MNDPRRVKACSSISFSLESTNRIKPYLVTTSTDRKTSGKLGADVSCKCNGFVVRSFPKRDAETFETSPSNIIRKKNGGVQRKNVEMKKKREETTRENDSIFGRVLVGHANPATSSRCKVILFEIIYYLAG